LVELANLTPKNTNASPIENAAYKAAEFMQTQAGHLPAEDLKNYAHGRLAAPKIIAKAENPTERANALLTIAAFWREIEKLGSRMKTYKWLKEHKTPQGEKLLSPYTEWDEVKDWLAEIDLPKGKAGRPRKIGTPPKSEKPVFPKNTKSCL
jgi:hypothetical protein